MCDKQPLFPTPTLLQKALGKPSVLWIVQVVTAAAFLSPIHPVLLDSVLSLFLAWNGKFLSTKICVAHSHLVTECMHFSHKQLHSFMNKSFIFRLQSGQWYYLSSRFFHPGIYAHQLSNCWLWPRLIKCYFAGLLTKSYLTVNGMNFPS